VSGGVNLILNILLIPRYGAIGAGIASVCTILVSFGQNFFYANRVVRFNYVTSFWLPMVSVVISSFLFFWLMDWNILGAGILSIILFFAVLVMTQTLTRNDLALFTLRRH
jgi:O-antigen/teichoic acid export membrane protein